MCESWMCLYNFMWFARRSDMSVNLDVASVCVHDSHIRYGCTVLGVVYDVDRGVWDSLTIKNIKSNLNIKIPGLGTYQIRNAKKICLCANFMSCVRVFFRLFWLDVVCARANFISHFAMFFKYINKMHTHTRRSGASHTYLNFHVRYKCVYWGKNKGFFVAHGKKEIISAAKHGLNEKKNCGKI